MSEVSTAAILARHAEELRQIKELLIGIRADLVARGEPEDVRQAIADITAAYSLIAQTTELASVQRQQIYEIVEWIRERISGAEQHQQSDTIDNIQFATRQIVPIMQGTRADLVQLRSTIERLAEAVEVILAQLPTEQEASE